MNCAEQQRPDGPVAVTTVQGEAITIRVHSMRQAKIAVLAELGRKVVVLLVTPAHIGVNQSTGLQYQ